ncbi:rSAM-modified peptide [Flavobacterium sp. ENC]|uniref:rSAM-modified peptide n=1 Tax=Flavobacterium sp. ENC TaxID=2897330 RepID=UPI001E3C2587|nr:rSAM-modified peptide [Flavobacterium sp. ENC]MCD0464134.1 rSAM-modified peptide [Flavobacterium sp. ENC]
MKIKKLKFEDFKTEKINKDQQKMVRGGDPTGGEDPIDGKDPIRGGGGTGNGNGNG